MANATLQKTRPSPTARLAAMSVEERHGAYERGELNLAELTVWAALYPDEVPMVNDELPWIALTLADLD